MFGSILGKSKEKSVDNQVLKQRISKMNLTEMRTYVNNRIKGFEVTSDGLIEVMKRLVLEDEDTSKRYILIDDMDSKKKKAFDLVTTIAVNKKVTIPVIELIQEFTLVYAEIITKYDKDYKEIYASRLKESINKAISIVGSTARFNRKRGVLGE